MNDNLEEQVLFWTLNVPTQNCDKKINPKFINKSQKF